MKRALKKVEHDRKPIREFPFSSPGVFKNPTSQNLPALDAQLHGERSIHNDYLPFGPMVYDKKWFFRIRDGVTETLGDYFRAVDYLKSRAEVDVTRIGVAGHSMGGMIALLFAALSPNVKAVVGCVVACAYPWMYPATPVNMAQGIPKATSYEQSSG
jgi:dienelactone hydrolase